MVRMLVVLLALLVDLQNLGETRLPVEQVELLVPVVWGNEENSLPRTVVGLDRNLARDPLLLVCVLVLGLAGILGPEKLGGLVPHHLH